MYVRIYVCVSVCPYVCILYECVSVCPCVCTYVYTRAGFGCNLQIDYQYILTD